MQINEIASEIYFNKFYKSFGLSKSPLVNVKFKRKIFQEKTSPGLSVSGIMVLTHEIRKYDFKNVPFVDHNNFKLI